MFQLSGFYGIPCTGLSISFLLGNLVTGVLGCSDSQGVSRGPYSCPLLDSGGVCSIGPHFVHGITGYIRIPD